MANGGIGKRINVSNGLMRSQPALKNAGGKFKNNTRELYMEKSW